MGSFDADLDHLSGAALDALVAQQIHGKGVRVSPEGLKVPKIKIGGNEGPKPLRRGIFGDFSALDDQEGEVININDDVVISVRLPGYMVASLEEGDIRQAVREWLDKRGMSRWAAPRFLMEGIGRAQKAKDTFTRSMRLE